MKGKLNLHRHSPPHKPVKKHHQRAIWIRDCDTQTQCGKPSLVSVDGDSKVLSFNGESLFGTSEFAG